MKTKKSTLVFTLASKSIVVLLMSLVFSTGAYSATKVTFNGTTDSNWSTVTNWSNGAGPASTDSVLIAAGKTVVIASGTTASIEHLMLDAGAILTNNGTLNVSPVATLGSALTLNGTNTFDNEGVFSISNSTQTTASTLINLLGTGNSMKFSGTTNALSCKTGSLFFGAQSGSTTTISGKGFTIGASGTGNGTIATVFNLGSTLSSITVASGTTLNLYLNTAGIAAVSLGASSSFINNGTINTTFTGTGNTTRALTFWQTLAGVNATFTNNGTFTATDFINSTLLGGANTGSTGFCKFENTGTFSITSSGANGIGLLSQSNLPNVLTNSGTINLSVNGNAIKINALGDTFTNTGTINIKKGDIESAGTVAPLNNNAGGVFNFNYGVAAGTTNAVWNAVLNNNSGGTINGSCTFANGSLVNNAGSTLSPGDFTGGVSSIGKLVTNNAGTLANVHIQVSNFVAIAPATNDVASGTDFDYIAPSAAVTIAPNSTLALTVTAATPVVGTNALLMYTAGGITGTFANFTAPFGWKLTYLPTAVMLTYDGTTVNNTAVQSVYDTDYSKITITKSGIVSKADGAIQIYTVDGKMLSSQKVISGQVIDLHSGIYIVKIQTAEKQTRLKVII